MLRLANGLIAPDGGEVLFEGAALGPMDRRKIGFVFQSVALFPHMSVARNIEIGVTIKGERSDSALVARQLELVELPADFATLD